MTTNLQVACRATVHLLLAVALSSHCAGDPPRQLRAGPRASTPAVQTATIHWQDVPLRDAAVRLAKLFGNLTFLDRRIDPTMRINLGMSASSAEQVWARLAPEHGWDIRRLGEVVYLGPQSAARQLDGVLAARAEDIARLPQSQRGAWLRRRTLSLPRLAVPRELVARLVQDNGWRLADAHRIPHDLWPAGQLHGLSLSEQLALLLIGFDLAYEIDPDTRTIQIVPLETLANLDQAAGPSRPRVEPPAKSPRGDTRQVYSLRVAEKPVGAVIRELARKLNWQIEFDEPAIAAAGRSLDQPVSVAVENADQDELLEAVLQPAGLTYQRDGEVLKVTPRRSAPVAP